MLRSLKSNRLSKSITHVIDCIYTVKYDVYELGTSTFFVTENCQRFVINRSSMNIYGMNVDVDVDMLRKSCHLFESYNRYHLGFMQTQKQSIGKYTVYQYMIIKEWI